MKLYVKSPAIEFRLAPKTDLIVIENYCHQACYDQIRDQYAIYAQTFPEKYEVIEGFTLTNGAFVDRHKAYWFAEHSGMLKEAYRGLNHRETQLQSYMIEHYGGPYDN